MSLTSIFTLPDRNPTIELPGKKRSACHDDSSEGQLKGSHQGKWFIWIHVLNETKRDTTSLSSKPSGTYTVNYGWCGRKQVLKGCSASRVITRPAQDRRHRTDQVRQTSHDQWKPRRDARAGSAALRARKNSSESRRGADPCGDRAVTASWRALSRT